jgi:hypothetical protein
LGEKYKARGGGGENDDDGNDNRRKTLGWVLER